MTTKSIELKFTYEDFLLFPEDGKRHELLDGDHFVTPAPTTRHQRLSLRLSTAIEVFLKDHPIGELFVAPCDVVLSNVDVVEPDLLFVASSHAAIITERNIQGPPDLVVEILSDSTRKTDEVIKRKLYERFGITEYWIIDPVLDSIKIYRKTENGYAPAQTLTQEDTTHLTTPLLPGLQVPLADLFA
ncbi:MAG: Uma2 family endonuclease [Nitrospirota bacterium]|nr:Uma2 family endonuclease [Nitrospirota bacterium]